jgi:3-oxoacyl-[acyl-carrier-protein] synthase-1
MKSARTPCRLAALGMVSALGAGHDEIWRRLIAGDQSGFALRDDLVRGERRWFGEVRAALPALPASLAPHDCRNNRIALAALAGVRPALEAAIARFGAARVGVVVGSSTTGIAAAEHAFVSLAARGRLGAGFDLAQLEFGGLSEFLGQASGVRGPCFAISTACSSGAKSLASARMLLEQGLCDAVIAGGVDSLCRLTANGFDALQAIAKDLTNPMSRHRSGLTLGEGGALFLMTREPGGVQLLGVGESSEAHHMSAPDADGAGAERCMRGALADAGLEPGQIVYLNLHGTGTLQNDAMESAAVARVFGPAIACSSSKPQLGHTLGASGAIEAGLCWLALERREGDTLSLPPHRWDGVADPALPALRLAAPGERLRARRPCALMSNSFGFGGSNCTLILGDERR